MRGGRVVKIRINPVDCMVAVDVLQKVGILTPGMSFAQCVSTAFHYLGKAARDSGTIPTRDGFEYEKLMAQFPDQPHLDRTRKLGLTKTFQLAEVPREDTTVPFSKNPRIAAKERQLAELVAKAEVDPLNADSEAMDRLREEILHGA